MNTESPEEALSALRDSIPAPENYDNNRAAFLTRSAEMRNGAVPESPVIRHNGVKGGHPPMTTNTSPVYRPLRFALRLTLVAVIGLMIAFAVSPDVRTFAQQIVQFFTREADVAPAQVYIGGEEHEPAATEERLSFEAAIAMVSYDALVPAAMPQPYQPYRAMIYAESETLSLDYRCSNLWGLMLNQAPQKEPFNGNGPVGESATVVDVTINGQPGQFVQGWWRYDQPSEIGTGGSYRAVPTTRQWDSAIQFYQLVWSVNGMTYSLSTSSGIMSSEIPMGICQLNQDILVSIAESLQ